MPFNCAYHNQLSFTGGLAPQATQSLTSGPRSHGYIGVVHRREQKTYPSQHPKHSSRKGSICQSTGANPGEVPPSAPELEREPNRRKVTQRSFRCRHAGSRVQAPDTASL